MPVKPGFVGYDFPSISDGVISRKSFCDFKVFDLNLYGSILFTI